MAAVGFTRTGDQVLDDGDGFPHETMKFDIPGSSYDLARLEITVAEEGDFRTVEVASYDTVDVLTGNRLGGWTTNIPGLNGFVPDDASVTYFAVAQRTSLSARDQIADRVAVLDAVLASLPANGCTLGGEVEIGENNSDLRFSFNGTASGRVNVSGEGDRQFANVDLDLDA